MEIPKYLRVILIAEDSPTQAENLRYFLERHGYQVVPQLEGHVQNGESGGKLFLWGYPPLVHCQPPSNQFFDNLHFLYQEACPRNLT